MNDNLTAIITAIISSGLLSSAISAFFNYLNNKKSKNDALVNAVKCSLYSDIKFDCEKALKDGYITFDELKALDESVSAYHSAGGNGWVTAIYEKVKQLPVK